MATAGFIPPTAICRHPPGSHDSDRYSYTPDPATPDATKFEIEDVQQVGAHLVMKVKYPNCRACAYEGNKVMVFLNTTPLQAMKWRRIDPHFRAAGKYENAKEAPSPVARFPASPAGWKDAYDYALFKSRQP